MSVKNELAKASGICLSTDKWTSRAAEAHNTETVHFIDGDWSLRTGVLESASFPGSHTGVRIAERMKEIATRFGLKPEQIVGFVHDEAANVELAGTLLLDSLTHTRVRTHIAQRVRRHTTHLRYPWHL